MGLILDDFDRSFTNIHVHADLFVGMLAIFSPRNLLKAADRTNSAIPWAEAFKVIFCARIVAEINPALGNFLLTKFYSAGQFDVYDLHGISSVGGSRKTGRLEMRDNRTSMPHLNINFKVYAGRFLKGGRMGFHYFQANGGFQDVYEMAVFSPLVI